MFWSANLNGQSPLFCGKQCQTFSPDAEGTMCKSSLPLAIGVAMQLKKTESLALFFFPHKLCFSFCWPQNGAALVLFEHIFGTTRHAHAPGRGLCYHHFSPPFWGLPIMLTTMKGTLHHIFRVRLCFKTGRNLVTALVQNEMIPPIMVRRPLSTIPEVSPTIL